MKLCYENPSFIPTQEVPILSLFFHITQCLGFSCRSLLWNLFNWTRIICIFFSFVRSHLRAAGSSGPIQDLKASKQKLHSAWCQEVESKVDLYFPFSAESMLQCNFQKFSEQCTWNHHRPHYTPKDLNLRYIFNHQELHTHLSVNSHNSDMIQWKCRLALGILQSSQIILIYS